MKTSQSAALVAALVTLFATSASRVHADSSESLTIPVGWLSASPGLVRAGSNPELKWQITYPSTVTDYVSVDEPATVIPKKQLGMEVRVLGAGVTSSKSDGSNFSFVYTEANISVGGAGYERIFAGTNWDVNPGTIVYSDTVEKNESICFGGRYYFNRRWSTFYHSTSGTNNVRTLVNGDVPPTTYPLHTAPSLENFIKPYLDGSGKVRIGPMDVIVFMELTHTDAQKNNQGYDLQDMVLLVTFKEK